MTDLFTLTGRTALVTGARAGIGRAAALALAGAGANVVLWGHNGTLDEVAAEVEATGAQAAVVIADLADTEAVHTTASQILANHQVDILVNNAGIIRRGPATETPLPEWRLVLAVNLDAVFQLCQLLGTPMVNRGHGKIINVASVLSFSGGHTVPAYAASKHAVAGLTRALANEWAPCGVNVNAIAPGYIATDNTEPIRNDPTREQTILSRIPAGRWGMPEDLAGAFVFLASPSSDFVHGHVLAVDGGWQSR